MPDAPTCGTTAEAGICAPPTPGPGPHHYSGTITTSPGARLVDVAKVRLEPGDTLFVDDHQVLHYAFTTFDAIDGVNFRVTACDSDRQQLEHVLLGSHDPSEARRPPPLDPAISAAADTPVQPAGHPFPAPSLPRSGRPPQAARS